MQEPIRVLIVDDHQTVVWGLKHLINAQEPRMRVVATASNHEEAVEMAKRFQPNIILLDLDLRGESSLVILPELLSDGETRVVILTGVQDETKTDNAVIAGARGIVSKQVPASVLLDAIKAVHAGELWLSREASGRIMQKQQSHNREINMEQRKISLLTGKEKEVLNAIMREPGAPNKAVAKRLFMSEHTLRNHLASIYQKLEVDNRVNLYLYASEYGLGENDQD